MVRNFRFVSAVIVLFILTFPCFSHAEGKIGVVLMHGKDGTAKPHAPIGELIEFLKNDYLVDAPDMPWSRSNGLNRTLEESFNDIDLAVERLKNAGATKIVVGGHSMGAAAALAYATQRSGLAGVLMIAAGHRPDLWARKNMTALENAKALIASGNPKDRVDIQDKDQGKLFARSVAADIAVSWFDPDGLVVMQNSAGILKPGTPVLFIIGEQDFLRPTGESLIFDKLPAHPKSAFVVVSGGHKQTPGIGKSEIADWLNKL
ncbi:MAG: alpha/beta hydrolase [Rhodospirillales bacterium]